MQVIAWRTVSEMTCNVSSGMLNLTHSLTHSAMCSLGSNLLSVLVSTKSDVLVPAVLQ